MLVCNTGRLKVNPGGEPGEDGDKSAWAILKDARTVGWRLSGHRAAGICTEFTEEHKSLGINSMSAIHESYAASRQTSEKTKDHRSVKFKSKFLISAVRTLYNLRIGLRRRLKNRSDVSAETRGGWPRISQSLKEKDKATFFSPANEWCLPAPSAINRRKKKSLKIPEHQCTYQAGKI